RERVEMVGVGGPGWAADAGDAHPAPGIDLAEAGWSAAPADDHTDLAPAGAHERGDGRVGADPPDPVVAAVDRLPPTATPQVYRDIRHDGRALVAHGSPGVSGAAQMYRWRLTSVPAARML